MESIDNLSNITTSYICISCFPLFAMFAEVVITPICLVISDLSKALYKGAPIYLETLSQLRNTNK